MRKFLQQHGVLLIILFISLPIKFATAQNMPWDIDFVPVVSRNVEYLIPPVGTLSSVAAYNLPMLQWLHLPAQWLTGNVWWTIFLTLLTFNFLGTTALYALGVSMFNQRVGIVAAVLFTFSEVGISSSYTAWAQLLLPGFFAMVMLSLWLWIKHERGIYLAVAGIIATAAFMTHFSALLLYPAMLAVAIATRARWQWGWLAIGAGIVILMFMPYLLVEFERDFTDVKAFISQEPLVTEAVFAEYRVYQFGVPALVEPPPQMVDSAPATEQVLTTTAVPASPRPRWLRAIDYALEAPYWYWRAMTLAFSRGHRGIDEASPTLIPFVNAFMTIPLLMYGVSITVSLWQFGREAIQHKNIHHTFRETQAGRVLLLAGFLTVMIALMIATRTIDNSTYWMGFVSIELLIASYAVSLLPNTRRMTIAIAIGLSLYIGIQNTERSLRLIQHDDTVFSSYNVSIYRHVASAIDYIAEDWDGDDKITVSYDVIQDAPNLWWVGAWHSIDPFYAMGMNFDFLLSYHHGLENTNKNPVGIADNADYIVLYTPSLGNYNLDDYSLAQFGTIVVLKPLE